MKKRSNRRGFSLLMVISLLAIMSVGALVLLDQLGLDLTTSGDARRSFEAQNAAEAGLMELVGSRELMMNVPNFSTPSLTRTVSPPPGSAIVAAGNPYTGNAQLIRLAPMTESSISLSRALVYEISVTAQAADGTAQGQVVSEVYRTVMVSPGTELPNYHAR